MADTHTHTHIEYYFDTVSSVAAILLEAIFFVLCRIFDLVFSTAQIVFYFLLLLLSVSVFGFRNFGYFSLSLSLSLPFVGLLSE